MDDQAADGDVIAGGDDMVDMYARIAQSAYTRNKPDKQKVVSGNGNANVRLIDKYTDRYHSV